MYHLQRNEMYHSYRIEMYHPYRNEIIREFIKGTSKRKISEILNLSRTSIDVYLGRMDASGKSAEDLLHSDDKTLNQVMVRDSGHRNTDSEKLDELTPLLDYSRRSLLVEIVSQHTLSAFQRAS